MNLESIRAYRLLSLWADCKAKQLPSPCRPHRYTLPCLAVRRSVKNHRHPLQELCHKKFYHIPGGRAPAPSPFCSQNKCGRSLHPGRRMPPESQLREQKARVLGANSSSVLQRLCNQVNLNLGVHSQKVGQPIVLRACRTGFGFI